MEPTGTIDADALRARLAEMAQRARDEMTPAREETAAEVDYLDALLSRQRAILTGVANALRGDPGPLASHSHHDLAERAAAMVALLAVTQASLEAASSGRRVTACDEIERLQRERDAAQWSAMATRQDIEQLARVVGRTSIELVLERVVDGRTVTQTPSAHVLADGRAYAPILGASVPASASLRDLIGAVEKAFGDGFKCTSTRPIGGGR